MLHDGETPVMVSPLVMRHGSRLMKLVGSNAEWFNQCCILIEWKFKGTTEFFFAEKPGQKKRKINLMPRFAMFGLKLIPPSCVLSLAKVILQNSLRKVVFLLSTPNLLFFLRS